MKKPALVMLLIVASFPLAGGTGEEDPNAEQSESRPLVQVNVSVDMDAINESLASTSESIGEISNSFRLMVENEQLDQDQQQQLTKIMQNLDRLLDVTAASVDALPWLVQRSRDALAAQCSEFFGD